MVQGSQDDLTRGGRGYGQAVEVPLADGGRGRGSLNPPTDIERPQIDEHKEDGQPPGTRIENEKILCVRDVPTEEYSGKHGHPDPSPGENPDQSEKPNRQEPGVGLEDLAREFEDADGFAERMAALVHQIVS